MSISKKIATLCVAEGTVDFREGFTVAIAKVEQLIRDSVPRYRKTKASEGECRGRYVKCGVGDINVTFSVLWSLSDACYKHTMYRSHEKVASVLSDHREISVDLQLYMVRMHPSLRTN